jgi:YHS domain-containing protein
MTSKKIYLVFILHLLFSTMAFSQWQLRKAQFNHEDALALQGYDPVAYFTQAKAVKGSEKFSINIDGLIYYCSSEQNKKLLEQNPATYEPQYGGWCAYAMGNTGEKVEINPETFKIVNNKLYVFYNAYFNNTLNDWNKNEAVLKAKADANWSNYLKK